MKSPLPPLSTLPTPTYPPSTYPPPSYFESSSIIYPALLIPAKRTGEIQRLLDELVFQEPRRKRVYALEEGLDYTKEDLDGGGDGGYVYNPKKERKLLLTRLGPCEETKGDSKVNDRDDDLFQTARSDKVFQDPRIQLLFSSDTLKIGADNATTTCPYMKCSVRPSYIELPATPYSLLTVDQALRRLMPTAGNTTDQNDEQKPADNQVLIEEVPSSFEIAGHIAHVNIRDESLPYKYLIGKAILDKNLPKIRMVVNKIGNIENEFRTFPMEILAGGGLDLELVEKLCAGGSTDAVQVKVGPQHQKLMQVEVKEHGCRFHLDFAKVYFNSRLQGEHDTLVQLITEDANANSGACDDKTRECIVADVMAGVGPFAIPLTSASLPRYHKTRIICHANDLNPISYEYLQKNARMNRCFTDRLLMYDLDGREFIHKMNADGVKADHFIMNLPQMAPEFLNAFRGWKFEDAPLTKKRPLIHVHCFGEKARGAEATAQVERQLQERFETALGCLGCLSDLKKEENEFRVRVVRDVGPRKHMFCVSFRLPMEVAGVEKLVLTNGGDAVKNTDGKRERKEGNDAESHSSKKSKEQ